jgi:uncharacterized OB-fold protein
MTWLKPVPQISPENAPFYEGLRQRSFLVPKCSGCGMYNWTPYPACRNCLSTDQKWEAVSGMGELYTFTEIHKGPKVFSEDGPYIEAFMKLEEGPRPILVHGNLAGVPHDQIKLGMKLKISYFDVPEYDITLYQFEAADA